MRYIVILIALLAALAIAPAFAQVTTVWGPPDECADEHRQIPGNRQSPCNYVMPTIERAEYRIFIEYPYCIEDMTFYSPGFGPLPGRPDGTLPYNRSDNMWEVHFLGNYHPGGGQQTYNAGPFPSHNTVLQEGALHVLGSRWGLSDRIKPSRFMRLEASTITLSMRIPGNYSGWPVDSNFVDHPDTSNGIQMVNTCLQLVKQEQEDREHAAAVARQEAEEAAKRQAEADAVAREQAQAIRQAEAEARIAQEEIAAALANKLTVAKTELIKTEALVAQHKHEETLTEILQEIVRIRLAGKEDRARITSEYLERMKANAEAFDTETTEIEARIQQYLDFNDKLMVAIGSYHSDLQDRLERLQQDIEIQQAKIDILEQEAREIALPPTPIPATEPVSTGDS